MRQQTEVEYMILSVGSEDPTDGDISDILQSFNALEDHQFIDDLHNWRHAVYKLTTGHNELWAANSMWYSIGVIAATAYYNVVLVERSMPSEVDIRDFLAGWREFHDTKDFKGLFTLRLVANRSRYVQRVTLDI